MQRQRDHRTVRASTGGGSRRRRTVRHLLLAAVTALLVAATALPSGAEPSGATLDAPGSTTTSTVQGTTTTTTVDGTSATSADGTTTTTTPDSSSSSATGPTTTATTVPDETTTTTAPATAPDEGDATGVVPSPPAPTGGPSAPALPSAVATPQAAAITVAPSTGLVQGDTVTISGTGWTANASVGIVQCTFASDAAEDCDLSKLGSARADAAGAWSATFTPDRTIYVGGTTVDCADLDACEIGAGTSVGGEGATAPIRFDPSVPPPPPPALTVTPSTGLLDGQTVTVTGTNYSASSTFSVVQCGQPPRTDGSNCALDTLTTATTDASGTFSIEMAVQRLVFADGVAVDCAELDACAIGAGTGSGGEGATTSIRFDPSVPPPPPPAITVTPSTDLLDDQTVTVAGTDFRPDTVVSLAQCLATLEPGSCTTVGIGGPQPTLQADAAGSFSTGLTVRRILYTPSGTVDCATAACVVVAGSYQPQAVAPISFDASVPPPPPPSIEVTPDTDLLDGQTVTVTGTGFDLGDGFPIRVVQCATADLDPVVGCQSSGPAAGVTAAPDGSFSLDVRVERLLYLPSGTVDCADPGACVVVAQGFLPYGPSAQADLAFDPTAPLPPPPQVTVTPSAGLAEGQLVRVTGTNYPPGRPVSVIQCRTEPGGQPGCDLSTLVSVQASETGTFDVDVVVDRYLWVDVGEVDCADPDACILAAGVPLYGPGDAVPISIDPDAPPPPGPTLTISPATGAADGATVTVTGSGWARGATVGLVQCRVGGPSSGAGCNLDALQWVEVGSDGSFVAQLTVRRYLDVDVGRVDCAAPGACDVAAGVPPDGSRGEASVPFVVGATGAGEPDGSGDAGGAGDSGDRGGPDTGAGGTGSASRSPGTTSGPIAPRFTG